MKKSDEEKNKDMLDLVTGRYSRAKSAKSEQSARMKLDLMFFQGKQDLYLNSQDKIISPTAETRKALRAKNVIFAYQNRLRPAARVLVSKITQNQPVIYCLPIAAGEKPKQSASAATDLLSDIRHRKFYLNKDVECAEWMVVCGKAFKMPYPQVTKIINPETGEDDLRVEVGIAVYSSLEVLVAPGVIKIDESPWIILQRYTSTDAIENRYDIELKFDNDESQNEDETAALDFESERKGDLRLVREMLEKPSRKHPRGRHVVVVEDRVVWSDEFPYWDKTSDGREICSGYRLIPYDFDVTMTSCWPDGLIHNCIDEQKKINLLWTQWVTYAVHCTTPKLGKQKNTKLPEDFWQNVPTVVEIGDNDDPPAWLKTAEINPAVQAALTEAKLAFDEASGIHAITKGNEPKQRMPFLAVQYMTEMDLEKYGSLFDRYEESERALGIAILKTIQQFATEYPYRTLGRNRETEIKTFMVDDLEDHEIVVERGSGLPESKAGKTAQLLEINQNGGLDLQNRPTRVAFFRALEQGWANDMVAGETHSLDLADIENGRLLNGEPVEVDPLHDHELHVYTHRKILDGPDFYQLDPFVKDESRKHTYQHQAFLTPPPVMGADPNSITSEAPPPMAPGEMPMGGGQPMEAMDMAGLMPPSVPVGNEAPAGIADLLGPPPTSGQTGGL